MITYDLLLTEGACYEERAAFDELFPEGVEVTEELVVRHAQVFDWEWAIKHLLDDSRSVQAQERALAQRRYDALAQVSSQPAALKSAYEKAWAEYNLAAARLFATSFIAQGGRELLPDEVVKQGKV